MLNHRKTSYNCRFCNEQLMRRELHETSLVYRLLPLKSFKCPHCFCTYARPDEVFLIIPGLRSLLNRRGAKRKEGQQKNYGLADDRPLPFTPLGLLARVARFTGAIEKIIWGVLMGVLKLLFSRRTSRSVVHTESLSRRERSSRSSRSHGHGHRQSGSDSARAVSAQR